MITTHTRARQIIRYLLALSLVCNPADSPAQSAIRKGAYTTTVQVRNAIRRLLSDAPLTRASVGIKIISLSKGTVLFSQDDGKLFHPASTLKLVTTAAALHDLGPGYRFTTRITAGGEQHGNTLVGDLVIRGSGDPLLSVADLDSMIMELKTRGIQAITGNLIGNRALFDTIGWGAGWMWDDEPNSDEAFITPLTVEGNSILFTVTPGGRAGMSPAYEIRPVTAYITVQNDAVTAVDTLIPALEITRHHGENRFRITGRIEPGAIPVENLLSVANPDLYFLTLFREHLNSNGIKFNGGLRIDTVTGGRELVDYMHTLDTVLHFMNKTSNNIAAENILRAIGVQQSGLPGSALKGIEAVNTYLARSGIDTSMLHMADGSGVSWYNIITPDVMVRILASEYRQSRTFPIFFNSLPTGGVDGTLKGRFRGSPAAGRVHAKTGSLSGVSTLAGYVRGADNQLFAFSIMCDHYPGNLNELRRLQDEIVILLARSRLKK